MNDVLKETFDLESCSSDVFIELNVFSSGITDYSFFNYEKLYAIFKNNPEITLKKSAIEQLSILINDRSDNLGVTGRRLFREDKKGEDVFSVAIQELLALNEIAMKRGINNLHPNELNYIQELLRFLSLSFLFYFDEPVVIDLIKSYLEIDDSENFENSLLSSLIDSLRLCLSSKLVNIRKNSLRCIQIILLSDQVKTCIDMNTGLPYFSVPTYMTDTYIFLFPVKYFKYTLVSKISLLNPEEKSMVQLENQRKEQLKNLGKYEAIVPYSLCKFKITDKNWFDLIERLTTEESFAFLSTDIFMKLTNNKSSISRNVYNNESEVQIKDSFEIVPSETDSAKALSAFYLQLRVLLRDLKFKITHSDCEELSRGLKSFYLLVISKMRELNLPYHYVYSQIIEVGIENRKTCHMGPLKLTEYA